VFLRRNVHFDRACEENLLSLQCYLQFKQAEIYQVPGQDLVQNTSGQNTVVRCLFVTIAMYGVLLIKYQYAATVTIH
jgi:hypothetical protein